jgi:hypothetical protein
MKTYVSNAEYFDELMSLAARMERSGHLAAATEVRHGLSCLNGLTDGWALLMDSLELTLRDNGNNLATDQMEDLRNAFEAARKAVYRL